MRFILLIKLFRVFFGNITSIFEELKVVCRYDDTHLYKVKQLMVYTTRVAITTASFFFYYVYTVFTVSDKRKLNVTIVPQLLGSFETKFYQSGK